jgi:hypothetical protein
VNSAADAVVSFNEVDFILLVLFAFADPPAKELSRRVPARELMSRS